MVLYTKASTTQELQQILELQRINLAQNISQKERQEQGFVTVQHDLPLLQLMNEKYGHIVAKANEQVVGYALVMLKELKHHVPILEPMFNRIEHLTYKDFAIIDLNYFVLGQICVAKDYRGKGIFSGLYRKMKQEMSEDFDLIITEVAVSNTRSMKAHKKVGFECIDQYREVDGKEWNIVAWFW